MKLDGSISNLCERKGAGIRNRTKHFPAYFCLMTVLSRIKAPCEFVGQLHWDFVFSTEIVRAILNSHLDQGQLYSGESFHNEV